MNWIDPGNSKISYNNPNLQHPLRAYFFPSGKCNCGSGSLNNQDNFGFRIAILKVYYLLDEIYLDNDFDDNFTENARKYNMIHPTAFQ